MKIYEQRDYPGSLDDPPEGPGWEVAGFFGAIRHDSITDCYEHRSVTLWVNRGDIEYDVTISDSSPGPGWVPFQVLPQPLMSSPKYAWRKEKAK